jgi:hypothetical protein
VGEGPDVEDAQAGALGELSDLGLGLVVVGGDEHVERLAADLVVPLSGRWFIETQDGTRVEMGPGEIHWAQDPNTRKVNGDVGHRSGQVGDEPCVQLMVQFSEPHNAGHFDPLE